MRTITSQRAAAIFSLPFFFFVLVSSNVARAECDFPSVKAQIDNVIDKDAAIGARFRKEFKEGSDPIAILETMFTPEMVKQMDECRFFAAEYLAKRGYPPGH